MNQPLLVLVKHAQPVLNAALPPREWTLSSEGEKQAARLGERLKAFLPLRLYASSEPRASRSCEIVSAVLHLPFSQSDSLCEIDRHPSAVVSEAAHAEVNRTVFERPREATVGDESASEALARFSDAIKTLTRDVVENVVVVTHGTVISLFVGAHNPVDPFVLWKSLRCCDFVVLQRPEYALRRALS